MEPFHQKIRIFGTIFLEGGTMRRIKWGCFVIALLLTGTNFAQDKGYARLVIDTLTSDDYAGRGYVKDGHLKAADFIASEFDRFGLERFDSDYKQEYAIDVNTFGGTVDIFIDKKLLLPGVDFLVHPSCPKVSGTFKLQWLNHKIVGNPKKMGKFTTSDLSDVFLIVATEGIEGSVALEFMNSQI